MDCKFYFHELCDTMQIIFVQHMREKEFLGLVFTLKFIYTFTYALKKDVFTFAIFEHNSRLWYLQSISFKGGSKLWRNYWKNPFVSFLIAVQLSNKLINDIKNPTDGFFINLSIWETSSREDLTKVQIIVTKRTHLLLLLFDITITWMVPLYQWASRKLTNIISVQCLLPFYVPIFNINTSRPVFADKSMTHND